MTGLARSLGIHTLDDPDRLGLAVTLGGGEVRLLELAAAYAAFANGGHALQPVAVRRVEDARGQVLWSQGPGEGQATLDERVAYLITDILSDGAARLPSFGEGSALELGRPAAVKTGTTTDFRDNWTLGYTPELVVGVWAGNADNEPMHEISGISGAAPIWHDFMEAALKGQPVAQFERPEGLVEVEVCALSGLRPGPACPHRVTELFLEGTEPVETCTLHQRVAIDRATGLRATAGTPPDRVVERLYTVLPPEAQEWAREQGLPEPPPPAESAAGGSEAAAPSLPAPGKGPLTMNSPDAGAVYRLDRSLPRDAQQIEISVRTDAGVSLAQVTLLVDGQPLADLSAPPYRVMWPLEVGTHQFSAQGLTASGQILLSDSTRIEVRE
jgi:membrane peptidoglycan carboxypeptidase